MSLQRVSLAVGAALLLANCNVSQTASRQVAAAAPPLHTQLTAQDLAMADAALQQALERQASGVPLSWQNPATGHAGRVAPVRTFRGGGGIYCRDFRETILIGGRSETYQATACRTAAGVWQPV